MNSKRSHRNCKQYHEMINMFVDTELDQDSQHQLFKHLALCDECEEFLDVIMKFKVAKQQDQIEYPPELDSMVFEELKVRKNVYTIGKIDPPAVKIPFWRRQIALSFPIAAVLVLSFLIGVGSLVFTAEGKRLPIREGLVSLMQQGRQYEKVFVVQDAYIYAQPECDVIGVKSENKDQRPQL